MKFARWISKDDIHLLPVFICTGQATLQASQTGYIPQDEANQQRIIAHTELAKPGETVYLTLTVPPPGTYPYICTYAGHFTMMQGDLISE